MELTVKTKTIFVSNHNRKSLSSHLRQRFSRQDTKKERKMINQTSSKFKTFGLQNTLKKIQADWKKHLQSTNLIKYQHPEFTETTSNQLVKDKQPNQKMGKEYEDEDIVPKRM